MFIKLKKFTDVKKIGYKNDDFKKLYNINDDKKNIDNYIFVNVDNIIYIDNHFIYCTEFTLYCSDSGVKKIMKKISVKWLSKENEHYYGYGTITLHTDNEIGIEWYTTQEESEKSLKGGNENER